MGGLTIQYAKIPETKRNSPLRIQRKKSSLPIKSPADRILFLQRTIGNQAVQQLIKSGTLQAKLRIGQPGDKYEQEADRVADAVMRMPEPGVQRQLKPEEEEETLQTKPPVNQITPLVQVQRQEEPEEEEEMLQAESREDATSDLTNNLELQINAIKGGGQLLPESARAYFEPRFGRNFSQVRLHTDTRAAESARAVNARAFTVGQDVVFGAGQYAQGTSEGRRLMAHELTHVVQQSGSNGLHVGQVGEKRGLTSIAHTIQQTEQINWQAAAAVGTADITLETGNIGAGFLNNLVHQQICVDRYGPGRKRCFSFAAIGAQWPQFSSTWLGWNSWVIGAILEGQVYEPSPVSGATVVSRHTPTATQGNTWLNYILGTRLGLQDGYSVGRHSCRTYSQWEFRDAPSHW